MINKYLKIIIVLLLVANATFAGNKIGIYDLRYTLQADLSTAQGLNLAWDDVHAVATLQGVVNRDTPRLYVYFVMEGNNDIDGYWWNKYSRKGEWLYGRETQTYRTMEELFTAYASYIEGVVVYDGNVPSTSNVASSVAGIENLVAIRYDDTPGSLYDRLVVHGPKLPVKRWLLNPDGTSMFTGKKGMEIPETSRLSTGSLKNDPYVWFIEKYLKKGLCNTEYAAYYIDQFWRTDPTRTVTNHHQLTNHDFFVSKKAFFFDLSPWGDEPATDDPTQKEGLDLQILETFLQEAYKQNKGEKFCYIGGFPSWIYKYTQHAGGKHEDVATEWEFSRIISAYNAFKDADAIGLGALANSSFWQHFPLQEKYPQKWVTHQELMDRGYLNSDGTINFQGRNFILFYVGDYDSSSWIAQTTPFLWDEPSRGEVPLMWSVSPVLAERVPMVMHNYRVTATPNDYFAAADNGAGYLMPGMLQEPRSVSGLKSGLSAWAKHCSKYYQKWGLTITGFVIDGEAPGLDSDGLDCYASFSPNGIVPQKMPLTLLHNDMPVIRADYDIVDHDYRKATDVIVERVEKRPVPFHWFRAILKSPSWYKGICDELKQRHTNIELLDAPTFFELYRIYLKQHPDAAAGKITMN